MTEQYGDYQLLKKLALGGMAELFLARRVRPAGQERLVVLKRILPHLAEDAGFLTMFLDEARIAARLNHPNVVEILDLGAVEGTYFIAMEFIHGEDMRRVVRRLAEMGRRLPAVLACRVVSQAARGLDYAHRKTDPRGRPLQIVHRDVSPQNILVSFAGDVKVVDFGIAKAVDKATVTAVGIIKGKHAYMSPEQAIGEPIDCRTDVFALGVVLYELLTGNRLFRRKNDLETLQAVSDCQVEAPSKVSASVPAELDGIVLKALAKEPERRFQSASELAQALENFVQRRADATATALGELMRVLFAARLKAEEEAQRQAPPVETDTPTPPRGAPALVGGHGHDGADVTVPHGLSYVVESELTPSQPHEVAEPTQGAAASADVGTEGAAEPQGPSLRLRIALAVASALLLAFGAWAAWPAPERPPLRGAVRVLGPQGSADVTVSNASASEWSGCEIRLPNNTHAGFDGGFAVGANSALTITRDTFTPDVRPPESMFARGVAQVECEQGVGYFNVETP